jgi:uncharacterized alpha-E superfamily protein
MPRPASWCSTARTALGGELGGPRPRERPPGARPDHQRDLGAAEPHPSADDGPDATRSFRDGSQLFLHDTIADLHLFKGAADATMSHGEGWRFMLLGVYLERAHQIGRLLEICFGEGPNLPLRDHFAFTSLLRMSCALEPYLRVYSAEMQPRFILEFLLLDEDFPRSIRFCTSQIEEHLTFVSRNVEAAAHAGPDRLAGRLKARLQYADMDEVLMQGRRRLPGLGAGGLHHHPQPDLRDLRRLSPRTAPAGLKD